MVPLPNFKERNAVHQQLDDDGGEKVLIIQRKKRDQQEVVALFRDFRDIGGSTRGNEAFKLRPRLGDLRLNASYLFTDGTRESPVWAGTAPVAGVVEADDIGVASARAGHFE